ncbi:MAG: sugar ABC transporter permease [Candidatus Eisenbacteria bacterium]|nr:sugar ABC transporter permease [Candidatus Eisenbacteria bacterium]
MAAPGRSRSKSFPYLLVLPSVLVMSFVVLYPLLHNLRISFTNMSMYHFRDAQFIGLAHYKSIITEQALYKVFWKTVVWTAVNVFFHVSIGVFLAVVMNQALRGKSALRAFLILPWAVPQYICALTWKGMFNYQYGSVNLILQKWFGLQPIPWFSDATWAFIAPMITNIWLGFPFMMIVALGGLQSIPKEYYEAASVDGASAFAKFREITLPLLRPILVPATILGTIWTFNNLNVIWLVTEGGKPADETHILVTYVYKAAFAYYRYGYAAAFSFVIFLILLVFAIVFMKVSKGKETVYV